MIEGIRNIAPGQRVETRKIRMLRKHLRGSTDDFLTSRHIILLIETIETLLQLAYSHDYYSPGYYWQSLSVVIGRLGGVVEEEDGTES